MKGQKNKEEKPVEVEGVEKWEVEKILNKKNKRSRKILSMMEGVYSRV